MAELNSMQDSSPAPTGGYRFRWVHLFYSFVAVAVLSVLAFSFFQPITVLPRVRLAPGFALENQTGQTRTSEDYRGTVTLYAVSYTRSGESGDEAMTRMGELRGRLREAPPGGLGFALVTLTVDPEHDTREVLHGYAERFGAGEAGEDVRWDFLRGDLLETKYIVGGGFETYYTHEPPGDDPGGDTHIRLERRFVLVDGWGIVRAEYRDDTFNADRVMRDLQWLASEAANSEGLAGLAYEAAHLFRCYP